MVPSRILVLGGTGFIGRSVVEKLVQRSGGTGGPIRIATRRLQSARHLQLLPTVQIQEGDVHDDDTLSHLLRGIDAVVNLVAILHGSEAEFERVHVQLAARLARACEARGIRRVVHISALGAAADAPSRYQRSKARGEAALAAADLDLTILRPSVVFGDQDRFLNLFASLQRIAPVMPLARADARFQPVWVDDVASAVMRSLDDPGTIGLTIECCGPTVYTLRQLVELAGRWSGRPRAVLPLPDALGRMQAGMLELMPGPTLMSRDNLDSMRVANIASGSRPGLERLGIEPTPLEAVAPRYLGHVDGEARLEAWRANARRG